MEDRGYNSSGLYVAWGFFVLALIVGALCAQHGDAAAIFLDPRAATPEQVERAGVELVEMMRSEGISENEIQRVLHRHRCKYLPNTEGCDG